MLQSEYEDYNIAYEENLSQIGSRITKVFSLECWKQILDKTRIESSQVKFIFSPPNRFNRVESNVDFSVKNSVVKSA